MKKNLLLILSLITFALAWFPNTGKAQASQDTPYVIMISFDGFRHDYVEKFDAPNFKKFIAAGAAAEAMTPSFPSKTFPNHYTLVTGLYPGNHGLVDNNFYDRDLAVRYSIGNRKVVENPAFYSGLPLWQLVQQNGMKSASYFWVGSEAPITGSFPDYYEIYDGKVKNEDRISAVMDWLKLPKKERPNYISLYFSLVDDQGHATGPNAKKTGEAVLEADRLLGLIMAGLKAIDLPVNVIITSDHGMKDVPNTEENLINFDQALASLNKADYQFVNSGTLAHLYIDNPQKTERIYSTLKKKEKYFKVYRKSDFNEKWHYQNDRSGEIIVVAEPGFTLTSESRKQSMIKTGGVHGEHGYDPYASDDMGAIFYANGPNIKAGAKLPKFENVNVYPLVAHILGIDKLPEIDGKLEVLGGVYKK